MKDAVWAREQTLLGMHRWRGVALFGSNRYQTLFLNGVGLRSVNMFNSHYDVMRNVLK